MPTKIILSDKTQKWIIKHFKHTKNDDIMLKFNLSHSFLHRFAREHGLKKTKQFQSQCQKNASEKARQANKVNNWPPKGYIIPRSSEFFYKKGVRPIDRLGKIKNQKRIERSAASRRKTVAAEKRRVLFGLPQKTKLKVVAAPHNKLAYRYLLKKRGYVVVRGEREVFYNEETERSERMEKYAFEKYKIVIAEKINN